MAHECPLQRWGTWSQRESGPPLLSKYCWCIVASFPPLQGPCPSDALTPFPLLPSPRAVSPQPGASSSLSHNLAKLPSADIITIAATQASILLLSHAFSACSLTTIPRWPSCWLLLPLCHGICFCWGCQGPRCCGGTPASFSSDPCATSTKSLTLLPW